MTEDEKKEFEEFLQWKKEKLRKTKLEQQSKEQDFHHAGLEEANERQEQINASAKKSQQKIDIPLQPTQQKKSWDKIMIVVCLILIVCFVSSLAFDLGSKNSRRVQDGTKNETEEVDSFNLLQEVRDSILQAKADSTKANADSIRKAKRIDLLKHSVRITTARLSPPNSAGGVDAIVYYKNLSSKTIKYFYWEGYVKNAVGDIVENEIDGAETFRGKDTGPIKHGKTSGGCWSCIIYNWSAKKLVLTEITIEYMDGTKLTIAGNELKYIK